MSTVLYGAGLALVWMFLWGALSWANALSGAAVAAVLIVLLVPAERRRSRARPIIRPVALLRLGVHLLRQLLVSNVMLIREIVAPRAKLRTGVVGVPVGGCSEQLVTVLANFMAMAPGTMPVEFESGVLYVHVLQLGTVEESRAELLLLRDLTVRALGGAEAQACIGAAP